MSLRPIVFAMLFGFAGLTEAADQPKAHDASAAKPLHKTQYLVAIAEYQLETPMPTGLSEAEILGKIRDSKAIPIATLQCAAVADTETSVKFSKRVSVTTGKVVAGSSTSRQATQLDIGTMLQFQVASHEKGAIADINYSTSRLDGDGTDESPHDVVTITAQASQTYKLGEDRLLVATNLNNACCIVVTVSEIP